MAVAISVFYSPVRTSVTTAFDTDNHGLLIASIAIFLALLGLLYRLRKTRLPKYFILLLLSVAEAAVWIGFDVLVQTDIRLFNCSFTLAWTLIVLLLEAFRSRVRARVVDTNGVSQADAGPRRASGAWIDPQIESLTISGTLPRIYVAADYEFLQLHIDGSVGFVVVAIASAALFAIFGARFLPAMDFGMSMIFQLRVVAWFGLDLRRLDQALGSDEASHGVIYVYIDAVLATGYIAVIIAAIGAMVLFIAGLAMSGPAVKGIGGGCAVCGGSASCCECSFDDFRSLFRDSKCLFFNDEGSSFDCCETPMDEMPTLADVRKRQVEPQRQSLDQVMQRV
ncbi:unnamed protein product [Phytophthora lilii]|uniref:Unnamed protein product n=1 Tax=Phytophthora lilii TaxID=2077276 RepID=A0A9W6TSV1_9STRA|nr:unnamed protein product [Phytophthora lilii]